MNQRVMLLLLAGLALGGAAACRGEVVPNGAWGDDHVVLTVNDNGARVEFDCAHGTLDHPLRLDDQGRFSVPGTYVPEHSRPARRGEKAESRPARYQGRLERDKLEFTVTLEGHAAAGPYTVTLAKPPKLKKCG
jgi:hypothetical protein